MKNLHLLKCESQYFQAVKSGAKSFELRLDDRDFQVGGFLLLQETVFDYLEGRVKYSDALAALLAEITYKLTGPKFGLNEGWAILGIRVLAEVKHPITYKVSLCTKSES